MPRTPRARSWVLPSFLVLAVAGAARAQDATPEIPPIPEAPATITLEDALAAADAEATDLAIARLQVERSEAAERIAWAALLPSIVGTLTYQRFDQPIVRTTTTTLPDGTTRTDQLVVRDENSLQGSITVSETLSLRSVAQVRIAEASSDVARLALEDARRQAHAAIARVFFAAIAARRTAELARSQVADALRAHRAAQLRVDAGTAVGLDVARAEVGVLETMRRAADADVALVGAWDQLGQALGRDEPVAPGGGWHADASPSEAEAIDRALAARSDVRLAEMQREQASRAIDEAWYRFTPSLTVAWTGSFTEPRTAFSPNTQWIFGATLSIPLYDGGARYGALRDAQIALEQADERIEAARRRVRVEVREALRRHELAVRSAEIAARQVEVARQAADAAERGYAAGVVSGLELDVARRAVEQAELQQILATLSRESADVELQTASGAL